MIDAKRLREETDIVAVVERYVELRKSGSEFEGLCPFHTENTPSFTVVPAKHFYHCFGCGAHGDVIDFVGEMHGVPFLEACEILGGKPVDGYTPAKREPRQAVEAEWQPLQPVPRTAPDLFGDDNAGQLSAGQLSARLYNPKRAGTDKEWTVLRPAAVYEYTNAQGARLGYVLRIEFADGSKFTPQVTFCSNREGERRWCMVPFAEPRPLYGLQDLERMPGAPVLVVEGEKCKDVAAKLLPSYAVVSAPGGSHGVGHTDWRPLFGRDVLFWPDADQAGLDFVLGWQPSGGAPRRPGVADILRGNVKRMRMLDVTGQDKGWDVADAVKAGWTSKTVISWAKEHVRDVPSAVVAVHAEKGPDSKGGETAPPANAEAVPVGAAHGAPEVAGATETAPPRPPEPPPAAPEPTPAAPVRLPERPPGTRQPIPIRRPALSVVGGGGTGGAALSVSDPEPPPGAFPLDLLNQWRVLGLEHGNGGKPHQNLDNCVRTLANHPDIKGRIWFDDFYGRYFTTWRSDKPSEWTDGDDLDLAVWFQRDLGMIKITPVLANSAMQAVGKGNRRDEPLDWMRSLKWDGQKRIEESFGFYFGAADSKYVRDASRNFWLSMVARIYQPGCQVDNMIVLESEQGQFKSSALGVIGGKWYAEAHESITNKDFFIALKGVMLLEIGELDSFGRAETTKIKQVVTCRTDRYRSPYGRSSENHPRRNIFCGSTNKDDYLVDVTGARRFWPVKCGLIAIQDLREAREQLFAEAVQRYREGWKWWEIDSAGAKEIQESRRAGDSWEERIQDYLSSRDFITVNEIIETCFEMKLEHADRRTQTRIADSLRVLGYERCIDKIPTRAGYKSQRGWRKKRSDKLFE